ncbi:hypothetical protein [Neptunomonas japonica]|uniref:Uncharacterized protein n=1 Tax=Neptunomonas japonica JAMM 1380 TaxID=1441457 RepID=A0A7R6PM05_9GAMM|nr:hypothetical protein [Neptunomonas japonica]BBB30656.1 hypothetical protein NEJAP_2713 [Neptunomonas japonica JAMM 1380]
MEIIVGLFIVFYLFMLTATFINKHKMKWAEIRKKYSFTRNEIKRIESETKPGRIFYAINNDWSNTNLISVCKQQEFIYIWGSELSCGWLFQPLKIPISDMNYIKTRMCFFRTRDVYEIFTSNISLQYAVPREH